jgi:hypothetical protein
MNTFMKIEFFVIFDVLEKIFDKEKFFSHQSQTRNRLGKRFSYFLTTLYILKAKDEIFKVKNGTKSMRAKFIKSMLLHQSF